MEFKKGDKVEWLGVKGVIQRTDSPHEVYPLEGFFESIETKLFTLDGRYLKAHTKVSLELIECGEHNHEWDNLQRTYTSGYCKRCKKTIRVEQPEKKKVRYYAVSNRQKQIWVTDISNYKDEWRYIRTESGDRLILEVEE
jgi:hypothetical protein